jgi:hypothetical protein
MVKSKELEKVDTPTKVVNFLEDKTVLLKPIVKPGGMNPKGHDGEFMYTDTEVLFVLPYNVRRGRLESVLTRDEQAFFEERLNEDLNIHKKVNNYWHRFNVRIRKDRKLMEEGYPLDLSDPVDNLRWRLLRIQPEVAPNWESRYDKGEYKFALVDQNEIENTRILRSDLKKRAYMFLDSIENSEVKMYDFLRVAGKSPSKDATKNFMKGVIGDMIEDPSDLQLIISIIDDTDYEMKVFIEDAIACGALDKRVHKYYLPGGDAVNTSNPSLDGTIEILKEYKRDTDPIYLRILEQIKQSK